MTQKPSSVEEAREVSEFPAPVHYEDVVTWHKDVRVYRVTRKVNGQTFVVEFRAANCPGLGACSWSYIAMSLRESARPMLDDMMAASAAA